MESREWYQLLNMHNRGAIVSGHMEAIEIITYNDRTQDAGIILYGDYKIIIPTDEMDLVDVNMNEKREKLRSVVRGLLGAKIDCIIISIDNETKTVIASRKKANEIKKKNVSEIAIGDTILVNIMGTGRNEALVEYNGRQYKVPINEIAWGRVYDIRDYIKVGDTVKMLVTDISEVGEAQLSLRLLTDDPFKKYVEELDFYKTQGEYKGVVRGIRENGIYVELRPGITVLCNYPNWQDYKPTMNQNVCVMIKRVRLEKKLIDGALIREL